MVEAEDMGRSGLTDISGRGDCRRRTREHSREDQKTGRMNSSQSANGLFCDRAVGLEGKSARTLPVGDIGGILNR